jgi:ubiquinone/menaquinone biosynthesis C-methylase UbiE
MKRLRELLLMGEHVCPWWLAYSFDNPVRRLIHPPEKVLAGLVHPGQTVLDIGCGMGHFSLGMAHMVGRQGRVIALDLQEQMLTRVMTRASKSLIGDRIHLHRGPVESLEIRHKVDFALAFWMAHEVPDQAAFFHAIKNIIKKDGRLLVAEPAIHVSGSAFQNTVRTALASGFQLHARPGIRMSRSVLLGF